MDEQEFIQNMLSIGIIGHPDQQRLWRIAQCQKFVVPVMATTGVLWGTKGGVVGVVAGALAGMIAGTVTCSMLDIATIQGMRILGSAHSSDDNN